jgi:hypothetical protein
VAYKLTKNVEIIISGGMRHAGVAASFRSIVFGQSYSETADDRPMEGASHTDGIQLALETEKNRVSQTNMQSGSGTHCER